MSTYKEAKSMKALKNTENLKLFFNKMKQSW